MALDATIGGATANSYITQDNAQLYFDDRLDTDLWELAIVEDNADAALMMACARIDALEFAGYPSSSAQALQWPRTGLTTRNGVTIPSTTIPTEIQAAQCELALALLADPGLSLAGDLTAFEQVSLGTLSVTPKSGSAGMLPQTIKRMLAPFLIAGTGIPVFRA